MIVPTCSHQCIVSQILKRGALPKTIEMKDPQMDNVTHFQPHLYMFVPKLITVSSNFYNF